MCMLVSVLDLFTTDWKGGIGGVKHSHSINNSTECRTDQYVHIYKYVGGWLIRTFIYIHKPIEQSAICFLVGNRLVKK